MRVASFQHDKSYLKQIELEDDLERKVSVSLTLTTQDLKVFLPQADWERVKSAFVGELGDWMFAEVRYRSTKGVESDRGV